MVDLSILDQDDIAREIGESRLREMALAKELARVMAERADELAERRTARRDDEESPPGA